MDTTLMDTMDLGLDALAATGSGAGAAMAVMGALAAGAAAVGVLLRIPIDQEEWESLIYYDSEDPFDERNSQVKGHVHDRWPPIYLPDLGCCIVQSDDAEDVVRLLRETSRRRYGGLADRVERAASEHDAGFAQ